MRFTFACYEHVPTPGDPVMIVSNPGTVFWSGRARRSSGVSLCEESTTMLLALHERP
jgi:hypothetical protein